MAYPHSRNHPRHSKLDAEVSAQYPSNLKDHRSSHWIMKVFFSGIVAQVSLENAPMILPHPSTDVDAGDLTMVLQLGLELSNVSRGYGLGNRRVLTRDSERPGKACIHY